jgi:hypothetical protein
MMAGVCTFWSVGWFEVGRERLWVRFVMGCEVNKSCHCDSADCRIWQVGEKPFTHVAAESQCTLMTNENFRCFGSKIEKGSWFYISAKIFRPAPRVFHVRVADISLDSRLYDQQVDEVRLDPTWHWHSCSPLKTDYMP